MTNADLSTNKTKFAPGDAVTIVAIDKDTPYVGEHGYVVAVIPHSRVFDYTVRLHGMSTVERFNVDELMRSEVK